MRGENKRLERDSRLHSNLAAYTAWRTAVLSRTKVLPRKPDDLFKRRRKGTGDDWKAQKAMIETINAALGGFDNREPKKGKPEVKGD